MTGSQWPSSVADHIADLTTHTPDLYRYVLAAVSATATLTGFYVDVNGLQLTSLQSYSITTTATTLTALANTAGTPIPASAVGFVGTLSQAVYYGQGGKTDGTITANQSPGAGYPQFATSNAFSLGRVG